MPIDVSNYQPLAFETLTPGIVTAVGITEAVRRIGTTRARVAIIGPIETQAVRYRTDGGNPTTTVGHLLATSDVLSLEGPTTIDKLKIIAVVAGASVPVSTYM